jgi:DNA-directed RNA polymerase specialized sigma24 family protein
MITNLVDHLDAEWSQICDTPDPHCATWSIECRSLHGCRTPAQVLAAIPDDPDAALTFLLQCHRQGETLAGRVVLQTMLGKLVRMSYTGAAAERPHALDDLVTHLWCQIARYPLDRRPHRIAANLALDTFKEARREWLSVHDVPVPASSLQTVLEDQSLLKLRELPWTADQIIDAAFSLSLITETTRDILTAVYGPEGLSGASAAARWDCSPAAIRTRCRTAVQEQLTPLAHQLLLAA